MTSPNIYDFDAPCNHNGNGAGHNTSPAMDIHIKPEPPDWSMYNPHHLPCYASLDKMPVHSPGSVLAAAATTNSPSMNDHNTSIDSCSSPQNHASAVQVKQEPQDSLPADSNLCSQSKSRNKKAKKEPTAEGDGGGGGVSVKQEKITSSMPVKKKRDRFNGMSEEEVLKRTLPDHMVPNLDICIIGINPGLTAAYVGHHYAGPGNHFWKCLYLSGIITEPMNAYDDYKLKDMGIGFTNIVSRTSRGSGDLTRKEIKDGGEALTDKMKKYRPKIAVFNGKGIYEVFCGHKNFYIGKQPDPFPGTDCVVYVMPSSSARCSQLPRAIDKVPFYVALKKIRDYIRGDTKHLDEAEVTFPDLELKVEPKKDRGDSKEDGDSKSKKKKKDHMEPPFNPMMGAPHMNFSPHLPQAMHPGWGMPSWPQPHHAAHHPLAALPAHPGSQQVPTMDSMFSSPPVLVKQEDMGELANYGLSSSYGPACSLSNPHRSANTFHGSFPHAGSMSMTTPGFPYPALASPSPLAPVPSNAGSSAAAHYQGPGGSSSQHPSQMGGEGSCFSPNGQNYGSFMGQHSSSSSLPPNGPMSPNHTAANQFVTGQYPYNGSCGPGFTPNSFGYG